MSAQLGPGRHRSPPGLAAAWVEANVSAAAVGLVMGLASYVGRQALGMPDPDAGLLAKTIIFGTEIATAVVTFAVYAARTGAVLQRKLPAFPPLTWTALHVLAGVLVGTATALLGMGEASEPYRPPALSAVLGMVVAGMLTGVIVGGVFGAAQAMVLRTAARDVRAWMQWSALSGTSLGLFAFTLYIGIDQSLGSEVLSLLLSFAIAVVAGVLMLPAVERIEPR